MKRLIACLLFSCLVFTMTACQKPATQVSTEPTTETPAAKTPLTWEVKSIAGRFSENSSQTLLHIMDYDATIEAVNTLWRKLSNPQLYSLRDYQYKRDYYNENSLFVIEYSYSDSNEEMVVREVYIEDGKLYIICERPWRERGATIGGISRRSYFLEVYDYKPTSADDIIFEVSYPKL